MACAGTAWTPCAAWTSCTACTAARSGGRGCSSQRAVGQPRSGSCMRVVNMLAPMRYFACALASNLRLSPPSTCSVSDHHDNACALSPPPPGTCSLSLHSHISLHPLPHRLQATAQELAKRVQQLALQQSTASKASSPRAHSFKAPGTPPPKARRATGEGSGSSTPPTKVSVGFALPQPKKEGSGSLTSST